MAYIGRPSIVGNFVKLDAISVVNGQAAYTMQNNSVNFVDYSTVNQFMVSLNSVVQSPGSSFTVNGSTITFASNLVTGDVIDFIIVFGNSLSAGVPTDATVSTAKIVDDAVTPPKANFFNTDPGNAADLGMLHIKSGDSGGGVASSADELVVEGSANSGISILSGASDIGRLNFGDSGDNDVGIIFYNHSDNSLTIRNNATDHMVIDSTGAVTKPLQPAFNLIINSTVTITANSNTTVAFGLERFDTNGDFASNTFTAPVTGKYQLSSALYLMDIDTDMNYVQMEINTSNRTYYTAFSTAGFDTTMQYWNLTQAVVADMDANDTAVVKIYYNAGSALRMDGSSYFSGALLA